MTDVKRAMSPIEPLTLCREIRLPSPAMIPHGSVVCALAASTSSSTYPPRTAVVSGAWCHLLIIDARDTASVMSTSFIFDVLSAGRSPKFIYRDSTATSPSKLNESEEQPSSSCVYPQEPLKKAVIGVHEVHRGGWRSEEGG
jgi:hypothetical protein